MRCRRVQFMAAAGAALLLGGGVVRAASDSYASGFYTRGVDAAAYLDQGGAVVDPFYVPAKTCALLPRVTLAITHEDNVFLDPTNETAGTSITLVPGLMAIWGRPAGNHLYADYGLSLPIYESEREVDDRPSHMLRLGAVVQTGKSQVTGQAGYRRMEDVDTVLGARIGKQDYLADLGLEHRLSGKTSWGLQGRAEMHEFDADDYEDYNRVYGAGRIYHRATAKSQVFVQGGLGRDDPRKDDAGAALAADFFDLSLGLRGKQSPKFHTTGRIGYMWRTYDDERRADFSHWIASLGAESTPFGFTTFTADLNADVRPAVDESGIDTIDQNVVLGASRRLFSERLRGNLSATFGQIDYAGVAPDGAGGQTYDGRTDRYWGFSVGADWWTRQHFSVGAAYSYMRRDGDVDGSAENQAAASYETGRWTLRASWNY